MNIQGFQKLTLLDFPEAVACIVFTGGCNLRCPFCHNSGLVRSPLELPNAEAEVLEYLAGRRGILNGVCISGGEPLLQGDLAAFAKRVKEMGYRVKLDTNGSLPKRLEEILATGLIDYVAMDIKSAPDTYSKATGSDMPFELFEQSMSVLKKSGVDHEFRTTVVRGIHTQEDLIGIANIIGDERWFIQSFKDSGNVLCEGFSAFSYNELQEFLKVVKKIAPNVVLRGQE